MIDRHRTTKFSAVTVVIFLLLGTANALAQQRVIGWGDNRAYDKSMASTELNIVLAISAGGSHSLVLKIDETVVAWGWNSSGQATVPAGLNGVVAIAAGGAHSLALRRDGTVVAWGSNGSGQATVPVGLNGVVAIAAGERHSLALRRDGTVVAWGSNDFGEATVPAGLSGVTAISAGGSHSLALMSNGTVTAWGIQRFNRIDNSNVLYVLRGGGWVTSGSALQGITAISAGRNRNLALTGNGDVIAWGENVSRDTVPNNLVGMAAIAAGGNHSLALRRDGTVVAWGSNDSGQSSIPVGLSRVEAIAAGGAHSLALGSAVRILFNGGPAQSATVGTSVPTAPSVLVLDPQNNPLAGTTVNFAVASGGGRITGATQTTNANGIATVGSWILGNSVGVNTLTATSTGVTDSPVSFTATGVHGPAALMTINTGNNQRSTIGGAVPIHPSVLVRDSFGNPAAGYTVTFAVASGGGSVTWATQTTNANGIATVGSWILGPVAGVNTLTATSTGLTGSPVTFSALGTGGAASQIAINTGNNETAKIGTAVPVAPSVVVRNLINNPVAGVTVTFAVASGGGSVTGATQTTNANGIATVGSWILGPIAGINTLTATSPGLTGSPLTFTATATGGAASQIAINGGNNQTSRVGTALPIAPSVVVRNFFNAPVAGVTVTFAVASGGGSITGATQTTNADGIATVGSWTLGTVAGPNTLTASVVGLTGSPVTFTATGNAAVVTQMVIEAGDQQTTSTGTPVPIAPSVRVRDVHDNPVAGVPVTFAIASGGGSLTGAAQTTNASGIATVGSWTLGATAGPNVLTATTAGVAFTAVGTASTVSGGSSIGSQQGGEIGPGSLVTITQTLTNSASTPTASTYQASLPTGLVALTCSAPIGTCVIGASPSTSEGEEELQRVLAATTGNRTVSWSGTIPGNGSVTITYQAQVSVQASGGTQLCVASTINGLTGPQTCVTVSIPRSEPGNLPIAAGLPNQQKPGSVLIFSVYTSSPSNSQSDSQISLTNTNPVSPAYVHLFFVDGSRSTVADQIVTLTQNQTVTFLTSDFDPGVTGYLIAVAVDANGCPVIGNYLIGGSVVRFESGHLANLQAIGVSGLVQGSPLCDPSATTTTIAFNGVAYDELPRALAVYTLPSLANGNRPMLIVNRIGGDLTNRVEAIGSLAGLLFDDSETAQSFSIDGSACQMREMVGNNLPRTVPRYSTVIPAGRTGWMKFWTAEDEAITGVLINESLTGLSGGYNLPALTTTKAATLTIPVLPAR